MPSIRDTIANTFHEVLETRDATLKAELTDASILLSTGLDSLGFAILVARLEEELGWDPFSISETPFYPETFGAFVSFYEDNQPR